MRQICLTLLGGGGAAPAAESHSFFPLLAEEARKRGYELPLPYGASVVLTGLKDRQIEVTDVRLGLEGNPGTSISDFVHLGSSSDVFNANLKADVFVTPFLNLYVLVGYVHNESDTRANITISTPGPGGGEVVYERRIQTELDGVIGGLGIALAAGYYDQAHFSRDFRDMTGITPGSYASLPGRSVLHTEVREDGFPPARG